MITGTRLTSGVLLAGAFAISGCGSSNDSKGGSGSGSGSAPKLESLSDAPTLDPSHYDVSVSKTNTSLTRAGASGAGTFSRAACESHTLKRQLFSDAQSIESFLCYIKSLEKEKTDMKIGEGSFNYYVINFPTAVRAGGEEGGEGQNDEAEGQHRGPPPLVRIRVGKIDGALRMDACIPGDGDTFSREVEFKLSATSDGYSGYVVKNYSREGEGSGGGRVDVTISGTASDFSDAQFTAYHKDEFQGHGWTSSMTFVADNESKTNTLSGANQNSHATWGTHTGQLYGRWGDDLKGSVKFSVSGAFPISRHCDRDTDLNCTCGPNTPPNDAEMCTFTNSGVESFEINNSTDPPTFTLTDTHSQYYDVVEAATLPTLDEVDEKIEYVKPWTDCAAPSGTEFTVIDATALTSLAETCEAQREEGIWKLCQEQQLAAD